MLRPFHSFSLIALGLAAACASIPALGDPAVRVIARAQTVPVGTANEDAADDPAIWRNPADPSQSLIVGTDKKGGLYVYNLAGEELSFLSAPGLNNVDLIELGGRIIVAASDRANLANAHISLSVLDPRTSKLTPLDRITVGEGEGYGICFGGPAADGSVTVYSAPKEGAVYATQLSGLSSGIVAHETSVLTTVPSQPEGCIVDPRTDTLYIGEENAGIWAIDTASGDKQMVAPVGTGMLVADVEGLAIASDGSDGGYLLASSQGDNAFAVYSLPDYAPLGRFRIAQGSVGSVEETDGIELDPRGFGPEFPGGLLVAQDGINEAGAQNFKLVRWDEVLAALEQE